MMGVRALKIGLLAAAAILALAAARGGSAEPAPPLVLEQTILLADVGAGWISGTAKLLVYRSAP